MPWVFELIKADSASLEIEADDNLHDVINYTVLGNTLRINSLKDVYGEKKFSIRINYLIDYNRIRGNR